MGLVGKNNLVPAGSKIEDYEQTTYMNSDNIVGRAEDIQTELVSLYRSSSGTITTTFDIILTAIQGQCYCGASAGNSAGSVSVSYLGNTLFNLEVNTNANGYLSEQDTVIIPNSFIPSGSVFTWSIAHTNGGGSAVLIGYKA